MSFLSDIRGVSEAAVSQLTERFGDLPRPLLAAIGAGDFAVERLAELRDALSESLGKTAAGAGGDAKDFAADLPSKVTEAASDVLVSVQKFAADVPVKTQQLVEQLPERMTDIREALSPEQLRGAVEGYTQLAGVIYGSLADRGDKKWASVVTTAQHDVKVVNAGAMSAAKTATAAAKTATDAAKKVATGAAKVAARADVTASAEKASAVHAENAAAAKVTPSPRTTVRPTATRAKRTTPAAKPTVVPPGATVKTPTRSTGGTTAAAKPAPRRAATRPTPKPAN